jgi:hypothetical protein
MGPCAEAAGKKVNPAQESAVFPPEPGMSMGQNDNHRLLNSEKVLS